eukprot:CFRG0560T1
MSSPTFTPTTEEELEAYKRSLKKSFQLSCEEEGDELGCHRLAEFVQGMEKNFKDALNLYMVNCNEKKYGPSCLGAGMIHYQGAGVEQDVDEGIRLFAHACDLGCADGCNNAGMAHKVKRADGKDRDLKAAERYFKMGCDADDARSCFNLSTIYLTGGSDTDGEGKGEMTMLRNMAKAFEYSTKACELGSKYACVNAARMLTTGDVPKDDIKAEEYKQKARALHSRI